MRRRLRVSTAELAVGQQRIACAFAASMLQHSTRASVYLTLTTDQRIGFRRAIRLLLDHSDASAALLEQDFAPVARLRAAAGR